MLPTCLLFRTFKDTPNCSKFIFRIVKFVERNRVSERLNLERNYKIISLTATLFAERSYFMLFFVSPPIAKSSRKRTLNVCCSPGVIIYDVLKCNGKAIYFNCFRLTSTLSYLFGGLFFPPSQFPRTLLVQ